MLSLCHGDKSGQGGAAWLNVRDKAPLNTSVVRQCGDEIAWGNVENGGGMVPTWPGVGGVHLGPLKPSKNTDEIHGCFI